MGVGVEGCDQTKGSLVYNQQGCSGTVPGFQGACKNQRIRPLSFYKGLRLAVSEIVPQLWNLRGGFKGQAEAKTQAEKRGGDRPGVWEWVGGQRAEGGLPGPRAHPVGKRKL